ncbi:multiheme c-type cytochrome [Paraglaciecola aquimarina]|uniref:Multiheme c-type cytochrome n=1 Tax=Paraglaciecola aquimarina TaxID=1235557 RepID=A0ABU3T103_9ALTE|nr:multiheme c-type cytochrome [Paraglaciecola aquimarina]MDU0355949.1 multiheme c-type cytochrome [Paraglaciecola aquimarina]
MSLIKIFIISIVFSGYALADTDAKNCVSCHKQAVSDWQTSDHAKAMDIASAKSVLGDFSNITATHHSQSATFYKKGEAFHIRFTEGGKTTDYKVTYTFGHYPLQQYLIETDDNRFQVFPFSWDSRPKEQGGKTGTLFMPMKISKQQTDCIGNNLYKTGMACAPIVTQMD